MPSCREFSRAQCPDVLREVARFHAIPAAFIHRADERADLLDGENLAKQRLRAGWRQ
jgi:hypothetical protein